MLLADVFRGKHATGVMRAAHNGSAMAVNHAKLALSSKYFLDLPVHDMITAVSPTLTVLAGHNRHATKGASDNHAFAHPFKHGSITLMHNGSLNTHYNLTRHVAGTNFTVDSEAICWAFSDKDPLEVIPTLNGAFALVWLDSEKQTLNFVRNEERPLALAFDKKNGKLYWASEKDMLKWLLDRDMTIASGGFHYDEMVELPVGEVWSFPIQQNTVCLEDREVTPVDVYKPYSYRSYSNYGGNTTTKKSQGAGNASASKSNSVDKPESKSTGNQVSTVGNVSALPLHSAVDNSVGSDYLLTPSLESSLEASCSKVIDRLGREHVGIRTYVSKADEEATSLDKRIAFYIKSFEVYPSSVNKEPEQVLGCLKGQMVEYPFSEIVVHACKKGKFDELVQESNSIGSSYMNGVSADNTAKCLSLMSDSQAKLLFTIVLRGDTIKQVDDVTDLLFDVDHIPNAWANAVAPEVTKGIEATAQQEKEINQKK